jgi:hypothetical protein
MKAFYVLVLCVLALVAVAAATPAIVADEAIVDMDETPVTEVEGQNSVDLVEENNTEAVEVTACRRVERVNQRCVTRCRNRQRCNRKPARDRARCLAQCRDSCLTVQVIGNCDGSSSGDPHDRTFFGKLNNVYGVEGHHTLLKLGSAEVWTKIGFTPIWANRAVNLEVTVTDGKNKCFLNNQAGANGNICGKRYGNQYNITIKTPKGAVSVRAIWSSLAAQQRRYAAKCKQDKRFCVPNGWWTVFVFAPAAVAAACTGSMCGGGADNALMCEKAKKLPHIGKRELADCKVYEKNCERYYECLYDASHGLECEAKKAVALRLRRDCENKCTATHNTHQRNCATQHNARVAQCARNRTTNRSRCVTAYNNYITRCTNNYNACVKNANARHDARVRSASLVRTRCITAHRNRAVPVGNQWCVYSTTTTAARNKCRANVVKVANAYANRTCAAAYSSARSNSTRQRNTDVSRCKTTRNTCNKNGVNGRTACYTRANDIRASCVKSSTNTLNNCKAGGLRTHGYCRTNCYNRHRGPSC